MPIRFIIVALLLLSGCSAFPEALREPQYHNPFPQLTRVAVLPFYNQSAEPTVDQDRIALAYYNELQQIPGFEVVPVGVAKQMLIRWQRSAALPLSGSGEEDSRTEGNRHSRRGIRANVDRAPDGGRFSASGAIHERGCRGRGIGDGVRPVLSTAVRAIGALVRGESRFPPDSTRIRLALGNISGVEDTRVVRL